MGTIALILRELGSTLSSGTQVCSNRVLENVSAMNIGAALDARSGTDLVPQLVTHGPQKLRTRPGFQVKNAQQMAKLVIPV